LFDFRLCEVEEVGSPSHVGQREQLQDSAAEPGILSCPNFGMGRRLFVLISSSRHNTSFRIAMAPTSIVDLFTEVWKFVALGSHSARYPGF
jgi:hypothetical protein